VMRRETRRGKLELRFGERNARTKNNSRELVRESVRAKRPGAKSPVRLKSSPSELGYACKKRETVTQPHANSVGEEKGRGG